MSSLNQVEDEGSVESDASEVNNPFGSIEAGESSGEGMFDSGVEWSESESLRRVLDGKVEDPRHQSLPESGSALLQHDLANYFQGGLYSQAKDDDLERFDTEVHFGDRGEVDKLTVDVDAWDENGDVAYNKRDLETAYASLKKGDPTSEEAIKALETAGNDEDIPQFAREVTYRAAQVAKAARAYDNMRGSEVEDQTTELRDAIWAFEEFSGIDLEIAEDIDRDEEVVGNEALKFAPSTFVQNAYEAGVLGETEVYVDRDDQGNIEVVYESEAEGCGDLGEDIFEYSIDDDCGLGLSVSEYVVDRFGGEMDYEGDEESFRVSYTLQTPE